MKDDYMLKKSINNKSRLIPESYERRLSDLLESLPDEVPVSSDTEIHVIKHTSRFDVKALLSAAAAVAVMSAALISFKNMSSNAYDKNNDSEGKVYVTTASSVSETVTAAETTLPVTSVTTLPVTALTTSPVTSSAAEESVSVSEKTAGIVSSDRKESQDVKITDPVHETSVHEDPVKPVTAPVPPADEHPVHPEITEPERPVPPGDVQPPVHEPPVTLPEPPDVLPEPPQPPATDDADHHPQPPASVPHNIKDDNGKKDNEKNDNKNDNAENRNEHAAQPHEKGDAVIRNFPA